MSATDATAVARDASRRAYATNTPAAHKHAANLHQQAASAAFGRNDLAAAKQHRAIAQKHLLKGHELGKAEKEPRKNGAKSNTPDEPTQTNADPLLTQRGGFR